MAAASILSPADLAAELGTDPRTARKFLRSITPRDEQPGKGKRWAIKGTKTELTRLTRAFRTFEAAQEEAKAKRAEEAAQEVEEVTPEATDEAPDFDSLEGPTDDDLALEDEDLED